MINLCNFFTSINSTIFCYLQHMTYYKNNPNVDASIDNLFFASLLLLDFFFLELSESISMFWNLFSQLLNIIDSDFLDGTFKKGPMNCTFDNIFCVLLHACKNLIFVHSQTYQQWCNIIRCSVPIQRRWVTANDNIFSLSRFDDIDDIGHTDDSRGLIKHGIVLDFKIFTLS